MHPNQLVIEVETVHAMVSQQSPALASWPVRPVALEGTVNAIFRLGDGLVTRFPLQADDPAPFARGWKLVPLWQPVPHPLQLLPRHAAVLPLDLVWEPRRHLGGFGGQRRGRLLQSPVGGEPLFPLGTDIGEAGEEQLQLGEGHLGFIPCHKGLASEMMERWKNGSRLRRRR